ncbi:MAG: hypothetical protein A3E79_08920 [Burkholderiales bacterium RIFCSPHIGHO2_12_FULL_61_11]|nr:MAG: hypothetical protein A3E79_08920 [Burkholderiales bacterium RIFCSPHIGHO2_12_FULL_61_11]
MSASLFDLFTAETCPAEFGIMEEAHKNYQALTLHFLNFDTAVTEEDCLEAMQAYLKAAVVARAAFKARFKPAQGIRP